MNGICRHNNEVFQRHLPDRFLLSVDVAYRLALHMTSVGNAVEGLVDHQRILHTQMSRLDNELQQRKDALKLLSHRKQRVSDQLAEKKADDEQALAVSIVTACLFPHTLSFFSVARQFEAISSGRAYAPYDKVLRQLNSAISGHETAIQLVHDRKKKIVEVVKTTNKALTSLSEKTDPVLQNYGLVLDDRGLFILKRGGWFCLPWNVSFRKSKNDKTLERTRTPGNMFEIAVLEVGIRPNICQSQYFNAYPDRPPFNVAFLHQKTTQYLCGLQNERFVSNDIKGIEMDHFAQGALPFRPIKETGFTTG